MGAKAATPTDVAEHRVVESTRARNVSLRMTAEDGLLVVVPRGFDQDRIPGLLREKAAWIERAAARLKARRQAIECTSGPPARIDFRAIDKAWEVEWRSTRSKRVRLLDDGVRLVVSGSVEDSSIWREALRRWVLDQGRAHLVPWLLRLAGETGVGVKRTSIRCQRTRWGSYSATGTVSLNAQLLFLPPDLARYVLQHELCHVMYPDHSPAFWSRLTEVEPETARWRAEIRDGWRFVPGWLSHASTATPG